MPGTAIFVDLMVAHDVAVAQDAREVTALVPHADRMEGLTRQLRECLLAFAGMVRGHVSMRRYKPIGSP